MSTTALTIITAQEHLSDLHRASDERRAARGLSRRAEKARRRRGEGVRRGLRVLRPAV